MNFWYSLKSLSMTSSVNSLVEEEEEDQEEEDQEEEDQEEDEEGWAFIL